MLKSNFMDVTVNTFFAPRDKQVLDSIYFQKDFEVQCIVRPVDSKNDIGRKIKSRSAMISKTEGMCPRGNNAIGAEPFSAHIAYTGLDELENAADERMKNLTNLVKITVSVPHVDGMLPVISTKPLYNFDSILSTSPLRMNHQCSNIIKPRESPTIWNFMKNETKPIEFTDTGRKPVPYQYDEALRGRLALNYYQSLNLHSCMWVFEAYFNMTELVDPNICEGSAFSDGEILNITSSFGSVKVPIYVSQLYSSLYEWQSFNQQTDLILRYTYQNSNMFTDFVGTNEIRANDLNAQIVTASISPQGKFIVKFKTKASFRGQFMIPSIATLGDQNDPDPQAIFKTVTNMDKPSQEFKLSLIDQDQTFEKPTQVWQFESLFAHRDFAGKYNIRLATCLASVTLDWSNPPNCIEGDIVPDQFIELSFQQVNDPIAARYTLNTEFFLLSNEDDYLASDLKFSNITTDIAFPENAPIFGRVMIEHSQRMGEQFTVMIEKVFLCAGKGNYVPKFDPNNKLYGCLTSTDKAPLEHRFKILDKKSPESIDKDFNGYKFGAIFAYNDDKATALKDLRGADGFRLNSQPLFEVELGIHWYLHTMYKVISGESRIRRHAVSSYNPRSSSLSDDEPEFEEFEVEPETGMIRSRRAISEVDIDSELDMKRLGKDISHSW